MSFSTVLNFMMIADMPAEWQVFWLAMLPLTGVWSGCLLAFLLRINYAHAVCAILAGETAAGVAVLLMSCGIINAGGGVRAAAVILLLILLLYFLNSFRKKPEYDYFKGVKYFYLTPLLLYCIIIKQLEKEEAKLWTIYSVSALMLLNYLKYTAHC